MTTDLLTNGYVVAGRYAIERLLGQGGMGAVYAVTHLTTGKRLALKCMLPELVHNANQVGRFLREAKVMGRVQHRHIVDVFDFGRDGDVLYIVMELLDGKPLSELLDDPDLTLEDMLVILLRAMEGVAAAHEAGIVHRDLKPANIFVTVGPSGALDDPRVLDFGISKLDDGGASMPLTRTGTAMGTPYYMSMEQLSGQRDLDQRVDVYAMGVILYEAITGAPPYVADSISALAVRMLTTEPVELASLRPDLPRGLAAVVMKAIARKRENRHPTMRALIQALRPFVATHGAGHSSARPGRPLRLSPAGTRAPAAASTMRPIRRPKSTKVVAADPSHRRAWTRRLGLGLAPALAVGVGLAALVVRREAEPQEKIPRPSISAKEPSPTLPPAAAADTSEARSSAPANDSVLPSTPDAGSITGSASTLVQAPPSVPTPAVDAGVATSDATPAEGIGAQPEKPKLAATPAGKQPAWRAANGWRAATGSPQWRAGAAQGVPPKPAAAPPVLGPKPGGALASPVATQPKAGAASTSPKPGGTTVPAAAAPPPSALASTPAPNVVNQPDTSKAAPSAAAPTPAPASEHPPSPAAAPAEEAASSKKRAGPVAKGRAGQVGSDEF